MGKKDGKRVDKVKVEAKKAKQAAKQTKLVKKSVKKEIKDLGEDDIEMMIAEFTAKDQARTSVSVTVCAQPSPRSNFSMTALPSGEMLMFGGEFCDGEGTTVFNELYRWNVEKGGGEWKQIESLNTPSPRCSHQAVFFKDRVYVFGGEYATLDQFHHYRDLWSLDLKTNTWTEIKTVGDVPTARSGHRMVVWRNYILLFGGFYEALREVRWYNDVYLYSFAEERWTNIPYKLHSQIPRQRSGVQMCVSVTDDVLYVHGGYSKEKVSGQKKEGKVHEDMWSLNLKSLLGTAGSGTTGGRVCLDVGKAVWQKITKKGHFPSARCGAVMTVYKNKGLFFGGVLDDEGPQHLMTSCFYNDMFAFDMERKRWYQLGLKVPKIKDNEGKKTKKVKNSEMDENDDSEGEVEEGEKDENIEDENKLEKGNFFGYVDENGNVVYVDLEEEDNIVVFPSISCSTGLIDTESSGINNVDGKIQIENENGDNLDSVVSGKTNDSGDQKMEIVENSINLESVSISITEMHNKITESDKTEKSSKSVKIDKNSNKKTVAPHTQPIVTNLSKYFLERTDPSPRINPCLMVKGNTLYIYGGMTELGDIEVTLDDCWALDLNKRDTWKKVLQGTMHNLVWKGEDMDTCTEGSGSDGSDSDDDSDDDDSDDDEEEEEEGEGDEGESSKVSNLKSKVSSTQKRRVGGMSSGAMGTLRDEIEGLRNHLGVTDENRTPLGGESLRQFYSRTVGFWSSEIIRLWKEDEASGRVSQGEIMSEKEIKRKGFLLSEERYNELLPILARLTELEKEQEEEEEKRESKGDKGKSSGTKRR